MVATGRPAIDAQAAYARICRNPRDDGPSGRRPPAADRTTGTTAYLSVSRIADGIFLGGTAALS
jgi:hypothetical protein